MRQTGRMRCAAWLLVLLAGLGAAAPVAWAGPALRVAVSAPPLAHFVGRIGGPRIGVAVLPAAEPDERTVRRLSRAGLLLVAGLSSERVWVERLSQAASDLRVVRLFDAAPEREPPRHPVYGPLSPAEADQPLGWLSPQRVRAAAGKILDALSTLDPAGRPFYQERHAAFLVEVGRLETEIRTLFAGSGERRMFFAARTGLADFAAAFGLSLVALEAGGRRPNAAETKKFVELARGRGVQLILLETGRGRGRPEGWATAELVARQAFARIAPVDPWAADWPEGLRRLARLVRLALR